MKGTCDTHGAWTNRRNECPECAFAEVVARDFPPAIMEPWTAFAGREAPGWKAGMFPLLGSDQPPLFRLERRLLVNAGRVTLNETLTGDDQRALCAAARWAVEAVGS